MPGYFPFFSKKFGSSISLFHDTFKDEDLVIAGNKDSEGTMYDLTGLAVDGPGKGERLQKVTQFMGYWFAWAAFYPEIELF